MANLTESSNWDSSVYLIATTDPVLGGPGGIANLQAQALADRALWLRNRIGACIVQAGQADGNTDNQQLVESVVMQVATIAALRLVPIPVVPSNKTLLIATRGQITQNDGLASIYSWSATSNAADNGVSVIAPSGNPANGRWLIAGLNAQSLGGQAVGYFASAAAVAAALALLAPKDNPTFTGVVTVPSPLTTGNIAATTAWVADNFLSDFQAGLTYLSLGTAALTYLKLAGGTVTGLVSFNAGANSLTPPITDNDTSIATTQFVKSVLATNPALGGVPTCPTAADGTNTGQIASTAFVHSAIQPGSSHAQNGYRKNPDGSITQWGLNAAIASAPGTTVNFPIPFPAQCSSVVSAWYGSSANTGILSKSTGSFQLINGVGSFSTWIAEGF